MNLAVVGAGISGLTCAYLLSGLHRVTLYEKEPRLGGHTNTVIVTHEGRSIRVDTGFIVFNERNYPNFSALLRRLDVPSRPTTMSFSVRDDRANFEYGGASLAGIVGNWSNLLRPRWWNVMLGVASLARAGKAALDSVGPDHTIADLGRSRRFSRGFLDDYLVPMASAIWSAPRDALLNFPARFLLRFFDNHGMLDLRDRPQWRTVVGGSHAYIHAMMDTIGHASRTSQPVIRVRRTHDGVIVTTPDGDHEHDQVILATHADTSLSLLADASPAEREILGAMPYQANQAVLHTDERLLPRRRRCWAAWNYRLTGDPAQPAAVTYNMSILQGLNTRTPLCVSLNDSAAIDPSRILASFTFHHPLYSTAGDRARQRWPEISGIDRTHFCGAYWGNGFHEDGVASALRVCQPLGGAL